MQKQVAIVTGASSGIGKGIAIELVRKGFKVVLLNRNSEHARTTLAELKNINPSAEIELIPKDLY